MKHTETNPAVDFYFAKAGNWQPAIEQLRMIVLDCALTEELKWGLPLLPVCSGSKKANIVLIHVFKEYCALLFFKGALLKDTDALLIQQTENVQAARQMRFTNAKEIIKMKALVKAYVYEAIEVEKAGLKVGLKETAAFSMPEEFQHALNKSSVLKKAFTALTSGRQRAYLLYFAAAKQSKTREQRIENYTPQILTGKGLNDE